MDDFVLTLRHTSRLSIRIGRKGEVRISAPYGTSAASIQRFVAEHQAWIVQARQRMAAACAERKSFYDQLPLHTRAQRAAAVQELDAFIQPLLADYAPRMGVCPAAVQYRAMTSRWGSCQVRTKRISLSLYLLLLPAWCREHVLVHELAHLLVPSHSPRFYAVMDKYFPRWREARSATRKGLANPHTSNNLITHNL